MGIRPGEKLHETLITKDEAQYTRELDSYYVIHSNGKIGRPCADREQYSSDNNTEWLTIQELRRMVGE